MKEKTYKATLNVEVSAFMVPNYASPVKENAHDIARGIPLSQLDELTLWKMCDDFVSEVFKKAGKQRPPQRGCSCGGVK